jgi:fumarate hydratase subunit alpha
MREIPAADVTAAVARLCQEAARVLPADVLAALRAAAERERSPRGREILQQCLANAAAAAADGLPLCQDTGLAIVFAQLGSAVHITGGELPDAIAAGVRQGHAAGHLRASVVTDPLFARTNTGDNTPPLLHVEPVPGDRLRLILLPKGGGSENQGALAMLTPADGRAGVVRFVVDQVVAAGGRPCPPVIVGVGVGGDAVHASLLAKRALLRETGTPHPDPAWAALEAEIRERIDAAGVGPQGLGGTVTALAVHLEHAPCHLASLPVAIAINCHAARRAGVTL